MLSLAQRSTLAKILYKVGIAMILHERYLFLDQVLNWFHEQKYKLQELAWAVSKCIDETVNIECLWASPQVEQSSIACEVNGSGHQHQIGNPRRL